MVGRRRLDVEVVDRGLVDSRSRAQAVIMAGGVSVDGEVITRPSQSVPIDAVVDLVHSPLPFVGRGGLKLRHALDAFAVDATGAVAIDVGASTGGFTDVLLQAGARRVYAVDVGYGQLAWSLRTDPRVVVMERTNIRHLASLPERPSIGTVDVSFISLRLVLPAVRRLLAPDADAIALIKPQFEAGKDAVGRGGVVRDPAVWTAVLETTLAAAQGDGWTVRGLTRSPIVGPAGNVEFLTHLSLGAGESIDIAHAIASAVVGSGEEPG